MKLLNVQKVNDAFRPNSPWNWAVVAHPQGQYHTLIAVGYGQAPGALSDDETLIKVHNTELEAWREDRQVRA
jgi:hypothetical protein